MPSFVIPSRARLARLLALLALVGATAWLAVTNLRLAVLGAFSLDEFQYSHAGWRLARGETIYTDFFEHHFPLLHQLLGLIWRFLDDDPNHLVTLRLWLLPVFALALVAGCWINRRDAGRWSLVTAMVLLAVPTLSTMATQVRPDVLSGALFLAAVAVLYPSRLPPAVRGFVAGVLLVGATWGTLKVAYYGLPFVAALVADLRSWRRGRGPYWLGHVPAFVAGVVVALVPISVYLTVTGSWAAWYRWCIQFSFRHQWHYPGFSWQGNLNQLIQHAWWLVPLGVIGVGTTIRRWRRRPIDTWTGDPDVLLVASLVTTFASFAWQSAPYLYSLVPFTLVLGVFAARGLVATARGVWSSAGSSPELSSMRVFLGVLLVLLAVGQQRRVDFAFAKLIAEDNLDQRARLARMHAMTAPDEAVFHVWGGQISRPAAHYFYFLEAVTMRLEDERLRRELVPAMIEKQVTVYLHHDLFPRLVPDMRAYLLSNFQPFDAGLWVWGRGFPVRDGVAQGEMAALRAGNYFVWPPNALEHGTLELAGRRVETPIVALRPGPYPLVYRANPEGPGIEGDQVFVMWLPRDGRTFQPRPELKPAMR